MKDRTTIAVGERIDPARECERVLAERAEAMRIAPGKKRDKRLKRLDASVEAKFAPKRVVAEGGQTPPAEQLMKAGWRAERVQASKGSGFLTPAWVVRFEPNSTVARLARAGALEALHVRAAEKLVALHAGCVRSPKLTGAYDGMPAAGASSPGYPVDKFCKDWRDMERALEVLLPVERKIVVEVAVWERPIEALATMGLVPMLKIRRAEGAIVQTLRLGLERLSAHWGLDVGGRQKACK